MVSATPQLLYPRERPGTHCIGGSGWDPGPVWTGAENLASSGIRSPDLASRYTDWALPVHSRAPLGSTFTCSPSICSVRETFGLCTEEVACIPLAVRTATLNTAQLIIIIFCLIGCAMPQTAICPPVATEARLHSHANVTLVMQREWLWDRSSLPVLRSSPVNIIPSVLRTHLHNTALARRTSGRKVLTLKKEARSY